MIPLSLFVLALKRIGNRVSARAREEEKKNRDLTTVKSRFFFVPNSVQGQNRNFSC
jgi:hypothetical protein